MYAGLMAPDFEATALDGKRLKLSELRGKLVLLDFWATWCAPCVEQLLNVKKAYGKFAADGFTVVSVSFDRDAETARKFAARKRMNWPQVWAEKADEGPIANLYGVGGIPATFLIGPDGKVIERDLDADELVKAVGREVKKLKRTTDEAVAGVAEAVAEAGGAIRPTATSPAVRPADSPEARAVLEATVARYRSLQSYSDTFRYEARLVLKDEAEPQLGYVEGTLLFAAPNRLVSKSDELDVYYDGERLTRYQPARRQYTVGDHADALRSLTLDQPVSPREGGLGLHPLVPLLVNPELPLEQVLLVAGVTGVRPETRAGRAGQRLSGYLRLPMAPGAGEVPFTAFVNGQTQLFEEVRADLTEVARAAASEDSDEDGPETVEHAELVLTFSDVKLDAEVPAVAFAFDPVGARKVEAFGYVAERVTSPLDLLGRSAPALAGSTLAGPTFDLAAGRGRVAVVAFWGTWSPGAPRLLADLEQLAAGYSQHAVDIVGVNRNGAEGEPYVRQRVADSGARFCQVLDRTGELAEAWRVGALPAVFLVDAQGVIADVHLSWSEAARETVPRQLEKLLSSEPLYTTRELSARRDEAGDLDKIGGLLLRVPVEEVAGDRLEIADTQLLNASRWRMAEQDVDGDGEPELILPDWGGALSIVKPTTGEVTRIALGGTRDTSIESVRGVRIDGEVCWLCASTRHSVASGGALSERSTVRLHSPGGEVLWTFSPELPEGTSWRACATAGDLDGDGSTEFAIGLATYIQEPMGEHSYMMRDRGGRLIVLDQQGRVIAQCELSSEVKLLYVPSVPAGQPAPLLCLSGGQLERYVLHPQEPAEERPTH